MMNIDENNQIVQETIYKNITKSIKTIKVFEEFGYFKYGIFTEISDTSFNICFGFSSDDFGKVFEYSGKELFATEFAGIFIK
jgi:hypothetical protein